MRDRSENRGGMRDDRNFVAGRAIKILRRERDLLILSGGMRDSFKIDGMDAR